MFTTIEDRLRIPWFNGKGAIKVNLDVALPVVVVPLGILIGTIHSALTILVMVFMPLSLFTTYRIWLRQKRKSRTKLFYSWGFTSVVQMYITFQCVVVSYREVLLWENMLLHTLMITMFYAFYHAKKDPGIIRRTASQDMVDRLDRIHSEQTHGNDSSHHYHQSSGSHNVQSNINIQKQSSNGESNNISSQVENESPSHCEDSQCKDEECHNGNNDDALDGTPANLLMQNFGFSKDLLQECIDDHKKREKEIENVIPADYVSWVDSRMIQDGRVAMWCKSCRLVKPPRAGHCPVCNVCIQCRDHHCIWIDNCIGANNHRSFLIAVTLFVLSGFYGIHLTMTTLCTPVIYWNWVLVPNDCRFLYADFPTALCFVSSIYSICALIGMSLVMLTQCIMISQNVTSHEMHTASFRSWLKFGVCATHNTLSQGCLQNWIGFLKGGRKYEQKYGTSCHSNCECV